jgi:hypothetical protein
MLMAIKLITANGRAVRDSNAFLARVEIINNVARFYEPHPKPKDEPRAISRKIVVVRHDMLHTHQVLGGLIVVKHTHPDPAINGDQTVYQVWEMQPRWESDYARDYRILLPGEDPYGRK